MQTSVVIRSADNYSAHMIDLIRSATFDRWLSGLRDRRAVARITARMDRLAGGNPGDVEPVGEGVSELKIGYGPGVSRLFHATRCGPDHLAVRGRQVHAKPRHQTGQGTGQTVEGLSDGRDVRPL